jgi:hypothetical protein
MSKKAIEPIKGRVLGIDYSWHQGEMNFDKAAAAGAHFGFCRAGSIDAKTGIPYVDYQFRRNAELAPIRLLTDITGTSGRNSRSSCRWNSSAT